MTLPEVRPIARQTKCSEYCLCKQIELIIGLYACAYLLYAKVIVHFPLPVEMCHHRITLSPHIFTDLWKTIVFVFVENFKNRRPFVCEASPLSCYKLHK